MDLTLLHASDLHFGKHFDSRAAEAFLSFAHEVSPDLLVLSGDFTQRAKVREYREAGTYLGKLPRVPTVVTPGNHDVPLYRIWERLVAPHRNYRQYVHPELDTVTRLPGATVVALDSTAPWTAIVNGRIGDAQLRFAARAFEEAGPEDLRILVTHHNLARAPDYEPEQILAGHRRYLAAFSRMGVDLILAGHLHRAFLASSLDVMPREVDAGPMTIVQGGTTPSKRGRARERGQNSLNLLRVFKDEIRVQPHLLRWDTGAFQPMATYSFPRTREDRT